MNKYIHDTFKKLSESERSELVFTFKNSPTVLRFIEFLNTSKVANFKSTAAIEAVYAEEKGKIAPAVLENRFFKLRKKLMDEMEGKQNKEIDLLHTDEELKLLKAKHLIASENKESGYKQLQELEKICWEKNIFELLPALLDLMIFCNQSFNRNDSNIPLYKKFKKAIELQADMYTCNMISRQVYEINFTKGISFAQKELNTMRAFANKHKDYPRFLLCYHHVSAYYKLGSRDYATETQVLTRHLSAFKKLQAQYPLIPLMNYKANYVQLQHMHFGQMMMSYHFGRCEFEETYQIIDNFAKLMDDEHSIYKTHKTESFYYNWITAQCMTQRYSEANETIQKFAAYLKTNHRTEKLIVTNVLKARIYTDIVPLTFNMDPDFLLDQVEDYAKMLRKEDNMMISLDQTLVVRMKLLIMKGSLKKAKQGLNDKVVETYLKQLKLYECFERLIDILEQNSHDKANTLQELNKTVQSIKHRARIPSEYMHIFWLQKYIKHQLR